MGDTEIIQQGTKTHSQTATLALAGKPWIPCAVLLLAVMGLYWPALGFEFLIYDDNVYITDNARIAQGLSWENLRWAFGSFHYGTWQPMTWVSYLLDAQLFGVSPRAFHATNVLFHGINSALVFLLFRRMTGRVLPFAPARRAVRLPSSSGGIGSLGGRPQNPGVHLLWFTLLAAVG